MRSLCITLIVFTLLICLGVANYIYIGSVYRGMNDILEHISDEPSEKNEALIAELKSYWEKKCTIMGASISYSVIDRVSDLIDSLEVYNNEREKADFLNKKKVLENAIYEIKSLEEFSVRNIF